MNVSKEELRRAIAGHEALDTFCQQMLLSTFQRMGALVQPGESFLISAFSRDLKILPQYGSLVEALLHMLERGGFIRFVGEDRFVTLASCMNPDVIAGNWQIKAQMLSHAFPELKAFAQGVHACLETYPDTLIGRLAIEPWEMRFLDEALWRHWLCSPLSQSYSEGLVAQAGEFVARARLERAKSVLSIFELSAGNVQQTRSLLEKLAQHGPEFQYYWSGPQTEASGEILRVQRDHPQLHLVREHLASLPAGRMDLVIGSQALHGLKDVAVGIAQAKRILKSGGRLLLHELNRQPDFVTLLLGLNPNWWKYEDRERRAGETRLVDESTWRSLLIGESFASLKLIHLQDDSLESPAQVLLSGQNAASAEGQAEATWIENEFLEHRVSSSPNTAVLGTEAVDFAASQSRIANVPEFDSVSEINSGRKANLSHSALTNPSSLSMNRENALKHHSSPSPEPIAIIGMSGKYPMAEDVHSLGGLLRDGQSALQETPAQRLQMEYEVPPGVTSQFESSLGGFLEDVDKFDPYLFDLTPAEADELTPQTRFLLQAVWAAFEDAAYNKARLHDLEQNVGAGVGVYLGLDTGNYPSSKWGKDSFRGTVAEQVSHFFELHGPAQITDGGEISSLLAIHTAIEALRRHECAMSLVGAVSLQLDLVHSAAAVSVDDALPGEGVGAFVLKRLSDAEEAGDRILAVIRGSSVSYGGSGHSQLSPADHEPLMKPLWKSSGITAEDIDYVELSSSEWSRYDGREAGLLSHVLAATTERPLAAGCLAGNIGNLQSAMGLAQLSKMVLQLQHRKWLPTLQPDLEVSESQAHAFPLALQGNIADWAVDGKGPSSAVGRCGLVSGMSSSGSFAQLVVEEYQGLPQVHTATGQPYLFILSARNKDRLQEQALRLCNLLEELDEEHLPSLESIAYTLQIGRQVMGERAAFIAKSHVELIELLEKFSVGHEAIPNAFFGNVEQGFSDHEFLLSGQSGRKFLDGLIGEREWGRIAYLWVTGANIPWTQFYEGQTIIPAALPAYPFAKISCRVLPQGEVASQLSVTDSATGSPDVTTEHRSLTQAAPEVNITHAPFRYLNKKTQLLSADDLPVLRQERASHNLIGDVDLELTQKFSEGIVFRKHFTPDHPAIDSRRLSGFRVIPGVSFLEMATAALKQACGTSDMEIGKVVWMQPLIIPDEGIEVRTLVREDTDSLRFVIESGSLEGPTVLGHGEFQEKPKPGSEYEPKLSLRNIQDEYARIWNSEDLYRKFNDIGLDFGKYFKSVQLFWLWDDEAIGRLELPEEAMSNEDGFSLSPSILDGALQIAAGMVALSGGEALIPFSVEKVKLYSKLPSKCYVLVRKTSNDLFDLHVMDENWKVCVELQAFSMCLPKGESDNIYYQPYWEECDRTVWDKPMRKQRLGHLIVYTPQSQAIALALQGQILESGGEVASFSLPVPESDDEPDFAAWVAPLDNLDRVYFLGIQEANTGAESRSLGSAAEQSFYCLMLLRFLNALKAKEGVGEISLKILTNDSSAFGKETWVNPEGAALGGLSLSYAKACPSWSVTAVDITLAEWNWNGHEAIVNMLYSVDSKSLTGAYAFRYNKYYRRTMVPAFLNRQGRSAFRQGGVYLLLGSVGGVTSTLCRYLAQHYEAKLLLLGWPRADAAFEQLIQEVEVLGGSAEYWPVDATEHQAVATAVQQAKQMHGHIHGVIHAGFVLQDDLFSCIEEEVLNEVLQAAMDGSMALGDALGEESLDFLLFFSAFQSFAPAMVAGGYPAASLALDNCAYDLGLNARFPVKIINWGFWESEDSQQNESYRRHLLQQGLFPIEVEQGIQAIEAVLEQEGNLQLVVTKISPELEGKLGVARFKQWRQHLQSSVLRLEESSRVSSEEIVSVSLPSEEHLQMVSSGREILDSLSASCLMDAFQTMGVFRSSVEKYTIEVLHENLRVAPHYKSLLRAMLDILVRAGYLKCEIAGRYQATSQVQANLRKFLRSKIDGRLDTLQQTLPELSEQVKLVRACMRACPKIIKGSIKSDEIYGPEWPDVSFNALFGEDSVCEYSARVLAAQTSKLVEDAVSRLASPGARLTILELNAGQGGLSRMLLKLLAAHEKQIVYYYTDSSRSLLEGRRRELLSRYTFLEFKELNLENDPAMQGFAPGGIDLVIANNVIHSARSIQRILTNAKKILKARGILLFNEVTQPRDLLTLTAGISKRWWRFEDQAIRTEHSPFLSVPSWTEQLAIAGFSDLTIVEPPEDFKTLNGQYSFCAVSDGSFVEQKKLEYSEAFREAKTQERSITSAPFQQSNQTKKSKANESMLPYLVNLVAEVFELNPESIDIEQPIEALGTDDKSRELLNANLRQRFGELPNTLLFEYPTISDLNAYLDTYCSPRRGDE